MAGSKIRVLFGNPSRHRFTDTDCKLPVLFTGTGDARFLDWQDTGLRYLQSLCAASPRERRDGRRRLVTRQEAGSGCLKGTVRLLLRRQQALQLLPSSQSRVCMLRGQPWGSVTCKLPIDQLLQFGVGVSVRDVFHGRPGYGDKERT